MKKFLNNPRYLALTTAVIGLLCFIFDIIIGDNLIQITSIYPGLLIVIYLLLIFFNKIKNIELWNKVLLALIILSLILSGISLITVLSSTYVEFGNTFYLVFANASSLTYGAISYPHIFGGIIYYILTGVILFGIITKKKVPHKLFTTICLVIMALLFLLAIVLEIMDSDVIHVLEFIKALIAPIGMITFSLFLGQYAKSVIKEK